MRTRPPRATPRVPDLPGEADRSSEEAVQRVHRLAHLEERVEELRARNLVVAKAPTGDEVLAPQVLDERMMRIVAGRGSLQRVSLDGDPASDDLLPRVRFVDDPIANLLQRRGVGMPDPRMGHRLARVRVKIVAGRHLLRPGRLRVPEMDSDLRLVRALVRREPDVPIDAGERPAEGFGFRDEIRANLLQPRSGVTNESQARFLYGVLVTFLVLRKPLFVVVLREVTEEPEKLRGEVFRLLGHLAPPRRHRVSPVEHWREWPRVEDGADRADLLAADPVPLADEGRPRGSVRHHVVQQADVVAVDERLLRFDPGDDVVQLSQSLQIRLWSVERFERTHERQLVVQVFPRVRKVAFPQCVLI